MSNGGFRDIGRSNYSIEQILKLSKEQKHTCMYSEKELATFSQEKLNAIYIGIEALGTRGPWKRNKSPKGIGTVSRWGKFAPCNIGG